MCLGVPGELTERFAEGEMPMGRVAFGPITKDVCLALVPDVEVGQYVIVHAGVAIAALDEATAHETLELFAEIDALEDGTR